jgi:signal transduction histidine kinase/DNA-binding response OmpR family regulator
LLWLSTENGIIQFEKKTGDFKIYLPKDGTSTHEFNRISHFQDKEGKIYFGGIQGLTTFKPKDFVQDFTSLENIKIIPIEINQYKEKTGKTENVTAKFHQNKELDFYPQDRFLAFIFGLTDYRYTKDAIYYYKLKGIDKDWIITKNNEITISGMPYGKQILEVKALLENGKFTKEHLEISIIVHKPFYLQWWFFVLFFLILSGTTLLYIRYRTQKFILRQLILENEVKKRTLEVENDKKVIEEQAAKLIELDKIKTRFFANVSHELRTPITLIKAPIQFIIKNEKLNERSQFLLKKAAKNTNNLLNLVNEILDLTKLDNQKLQLEEEKVVLYNFVRQIVSNFQSIAQIQSIEMILKYQANQDLQLVLDKAKFQKILNNLLSNALKFTPSKGKITITIKDLGGKIRLEVADTGRGIPTADIPHIFERYFQSSQNNKAEGGLGIGLALSMELVKLFEGKMWLKSSTKKENQGTRFFVEFPKKEILNMLTTKDALEIEQDFSNKQGSQISDKKVFLDEKTQKTLLVVEDNVDLREYIRFALSPYYKVLTAQNGKEALEILTKGQTPALIISDLMMPIMDGYEFLETVKSKDKWAGIPFIMLTARTLLQDKLKALRIGVDDYITKPFEEEELLVRIENLLKNYTKRLNFSQVQEESSTDKKEKKNVFYPRQEDIKWLEDFEKLVLNQLHSPLFSNDYLAELLKIDRKTLYKKVKISTGLTPTQYIKTLRLKLAKDLLESRKYKTVKEVSKQVGFKKTAYFSKLFKEEYGKFPSDYF